MKALQKLSQKLGEHLNHHNLILTTAESCTGGGVSAAITDIAGSSAWFDRAFITYSNEAKMEMLGVAEPTLVSHGAVSEETVIEMVQGAIEHSSASIGVSISGIAGPGGGSTEKPVGTVCFAWADENSWLKVATYHFDGDRAEVRQQAVEVAMKVLYEELEQRSTYSG
ncbi:damage-inducible protein CinA [Vibrio coralliilyticus]|uniref:Damage-inducible protein CinA n=1 Tax=Vibrio coralliilyticus TaxID=190893 RepID=A0A837G3H8_9VIBR|nr:nicotinamide-nucleotide amidase [Vibrio coralliilyticus]KJY75026.1 damage-inducible protein CinA [Vibrio coralliilyticus]